MPVTKDEKPSTSSSNTTTQIQQIFAEVQSQLPSVNFDNDDQNDNNDNDELLESNIPENTDALIESLLSNNMNSFLTLHPKIETPQQPPSVELQMRVSPNLFDNSSQNQESSSKPSFLSMDLFNTIDFDKLPSSGPSPNAAQYLSMTRTFHRPRPINQQSLPSQQQTSIKNRDDRQILERLAQQANKYNNNNNNNTNEGSHTKREEHPFKNLEAALYEASHQHFDRHGRRTETNPSQRKTVYIDLRNSNVEKQEKPQHEQPSITVPNPIVDHVPSSESDSDDDDDDNNDGMLWFEKRRQAKQQHQLKSSN